MHMHAQWLTTRLALVVSGWLVAGLFLAGAYAMVGGTATAQTSGVSTGSVYGGGYFARPTPDANYQNPVRLTSTSAYSPYAATPPYQARAPYPATPYSPYGDNHSDPWDGDPFAPRPSSEAFKPSSAGAPAPNTSPPSFTPQPGSKPAPNTSFTPGNGSTRPTSFAPAAGTQTRMRAPVESLSEPGKSTVTVGPGATLLPSAPSPDTTTPGTTGSARHTALQEPVTQPPGSTLRVNPPNTTPAEPPAPTPVRTPGDSSLRIPNEPSPTTPVETAAPTATEPADDAPAGASEQGQSDLFAPLPAMGQERQTKAVERFQNLARAVVQGGPIKLNPGQQRLEMSVNSNRHLVLDQRIPRAEVANPAVVTITPMSPNSILASAKTPGVTQITLWGEDDTVSTVDVIVFGDVEMLRVLLQSVFPTSQLRIIPVGSGVLISGYVETPADVDTIIQIARQYYPQVINKMEVSGVQQVLLQVKVMEVSRTKLRQLGFDFSNVSDQSFFTSGVGDILTYMLNEGVGGNLKGFEQALSGGANSTLSFSVFENGTNVFYGFLDALREDKLGKVLAEPNIVATSGRPSYFEVGGQFPFVGAIDNNGVAQIEWKNWGTRVDFVAICRGNSRIQLEVRPMVSERDDAAGVINQGYLVPALKQRSADTGVELEAGQTLAIAGLIQERVEAQFRGLPWVSDLPYVGSLFRRVRHQVNEVELVILVTPHLVDPMSPGQVPACLPGQSTTNPGDCELFFGGHLEVPNCVKKDGCDSIGQPDCTGISNSGQVVHPSGMTQRPQTVHIPRLTERPAPSRTETGYTTALQAAPHDPYSRSRATADPSVSHRTSPQPPPGFIGPVGYDVSQ